MDIYIHTNVCIENTHFQKHTYIYNLKIYNIYIIKEHTLLYFICIHIKYSFLKKYIYTYVYTYSSPWRLKSKHP